MSQDSHPGRYSKRKWGPLRANSQYIHNIVIIVSGINVFISFNYFIFLTP